ncbi:atypical kinase COQ8B, mitochondrial-like [Oratosquilla oratoria]|uniref:atypical kinase COQ8B, mitochondrial-like n=1 Tax=Oratosquilla oratoria TaxID=337810 RepID=UPI003F768C53
MKIQYPGVADGIESDINNLISTLRVANILPEAWECDYEWEYRCTKRFKELVQPYPEFYVPEVIDELSTKQVMESAHVDAVMILGEAFQENKPFNFGEQNTTQRIQQLIPVMLAYRMCPPPEESYSLHRKMSGVFLLCAKLQGRVNCKPPFDDVWNRYKFGGTWADMHEQGV